MTMTVTTTTARLCLVHFVVSAALVFVVRQRHAQENHNHVVVTVGRLWAVHAATAAFVSPAVAGRRRQPPTVCEHCHGWTAPMTTATAATAASLKAASNNDDDNDEQDDEQPVTNATASTTPSTTASPAPLNVNELKRNLVQETVRRYKGELVEALRYPQEQEETLQQRLRDLIQVNPVATTTDSNLLEGESWYLNFVASPSVTRSILAAVDPTTAETVVVTSLWDEERHQIRQFYLEGSLDGEEDGKDHHDDDDDDDAHIVEKTRWGRLRKRFKVVGLTRTSMKVQLQWIQSLGGRRRRPRVSQEKTICIFYLDGDLCISTTTVTSRNNRQVSSPLVVYTKRGTTGRQPGRGGIIKRAQWFLFSWLQRRRRRQGQGQLADTKNSTTRTRSDANRIFWQQGSRVTAWRLGEVSVVEAAEAAWEGQDDPFVELSQRERQEVLRPMTLREIFRVGEDQRNLVRQRRRRRKKADGRKRRAFARPPGEWSPTRRERGFTKPAPEKEDDNDKQKDEDEPNGNEGKV